MTSKEEEPYQFTHVYRNPNLPPPLQEGYHYEDRTFLGVGGWKTEVRPVPVKDMPVPVKDLPIPGEQQE